MDYVIEGAKAILPDAVEALDLSIKDGHIETFSTGPGRRINGRNLILAPAMVDIHGDAFERQVMPRNGVFFPLEAAILDTDRQLAANGIATAYHALTLSWEPGLRAVERGAELLDALAKYSNRLSVENRVQLRW
ncbi:MAG: phosphonate metabolism protein PhnM, partial [Mangrovicoccus sp.]